MANKRIYYAIQQVELTNGTVRNTIHGLQTVGISTNFNLEQVFEMGQLEIYQNIEEVPEVEVTLNKVLDGYNLMYCLATETGTSVDSLAIAEGTSLAKRQNARVDLRLNIFDDKATSANTNETAISSVFCKGMYVSSVSYTFPVDGNFTEDLTLVGNDKVWSNGGSTGSINPTIPEEPVANVGVGRRQYLDMTKSFFPTQIPGCSTGQVQDLSGTGEGYSAHFQNITVSVDLGRESINELGRFGPYTRYATFPVEVTSEFEVLTTVGDNINAAEEGYYPLGNPQNCQKRYNLLDQKIFLQTCEGTKIHLGEKNKLSSVNYSGGDTGGGNVTVSYSFTTFNDFYVGHGGVADNGVEESVFGADLTDLNYKSIV